ncbi:MAG: LysR family transcriptional regulator [Aliidongia sp.]
MTQPPLSRQIQLLEHSLGVLLLHRSSRSVRLTPAGRNFLGEARRILRMAEGAAVSTRRIAPAMPARSRSASPLLRATASCRASWRHLAGSSRRSIWC